MDRLTAIQVFIEVANTGSFTKAADRLEMSRPMATRYITALEDWVGESLLQRTTRNVALTPRGEAYLEKCKQIQEIAFDIEVSSKSSATAPRGNIRVALSVSFALPRFQELFGQFLETYPDVSLDLVATDRHVNLIESHVDFALRISNNLDPSIVSKQLAMCSSVLVASPAYLAKHGQIKKIEDLKKHDLVVHSGLKSLRMALTKGEQTVELTHKGRFSSNETMIVLEGTLQGLGVAMLPWAIVEPLIEQKKLLQVLPDWDLPKIGLHVVFTNRKFIAPQVRLFIDYLTKEVRKLQW